jgi:thioredoxin 1
MADVVVLDDKTFNGSIKSKKNVLVYFWAQWCNPCKHMSPIVEKLAKKYDGKLLIGKLDVGTFTNISTKYSISTVPTFMLFKDGKVVDCLVGAVGEKGLDNMLKEHVD